MSMIFYHHLDAETAPQYAAFAYPRHVPLLQKSENIFAVGATAANGQPVGLALAARAGQEAWLYSVMVQSLYRQQGIGTQLVAEMEAWLRASDCMCLHADYTGEGRYIPYIERILAKNNWSAPQVWSYVHIFDVPLPPDDPYLVRKRFFAAPSGELGRDLPPGFAYQHWTDLSEAQREAIRERQAASGNTWYEPGVSPFNEAMPIFGGSSMALLHHDKVVGWMICQHPGETRVIFSNMFISPEVRGQKLGFKLVNEAVYQFFEAVVPTGKSPWLVKAQSLVDNHALQFYYAQMQDVVSRRVEHRQSHKDMAGLK